jgi:DNA-directed RNA polymerase subunit L
MDRPMKRRAFLKLLGAAGVSVPMGSALATYDRRPGVEIDPAKAEFQAEAIPEGWIIDLEKCASVQLNQMYDTGRNEIRADRQRSAPIVTQMSRELSVSLESYDRTLLNLLNDSWDRDSCVRVRHKAYDIDEPARIQAISIQLDGDLTRLDLDLLLLGGY